MRFRLLLLLGASVLIGGSAQASSDSGSSYSRWPKVRIAGVSVGAGYTRWGGYSPFWGSPFGYGYGGYALSPFLFGPGYYPGFFSALPSAYFYQDTLGKVKLELADKDAEVYLDGGFAGKSGKLKTMWVEPGTHDLRVTSGGRSFDQRIYVLTGKTLTISPDLRSDGSRP